MSKAQSRRAKYRHAVETGKVVDRMEQLDYRLAQATVRAQAQTIADYERVCGQLTELLTSLAGCQSIEEIHTTLQRAIDSGLLPSGDEPHEQSTPNA